MFDSNLRQLESALVLDVFQHRFRVRFHSYVQVVITTARY